MSRPLAFLALAVASAPAVALTSSAVACWVLDHFYLPRLFTPDEAE